MSLATFLPIISLADDELTEPFMTKPASIDRLGKVIKDALPSAYDAEAYRVRS